MDRIALCNIESFVSSEAILSFIEKHHDQLALVIASQRYGRKHGGRIKQVLGHYHRSGLRYLAFLNYNFVSYFGAIYLSHLLAFVQKKPRKIVTVKEMCKKYSIPYIKTENINSATMQERLKQANVDYIITCYFDQILKPPTIQLAKKAVLNVHTAYLPECRGISPEFCTALKMHGNFGVTIHEIDASIDTGPILAQKHIDMPPGQSILQQGKIMNTHGINLLSEVLEHFDEYYQKRVAQGKGSYYAFPTREDIKAAKHKGIRLTSFSEFVGAFV